MRLGVWNRQDADRCDRQTADTFDAAATFFDLTREWGTPDAETLQKIKFAKWNAARILKAIRNGEDPNESNPKAPEPEPEPELPDPAEVELDPSSLETPGGDSSSSARQVKLEEVPDAGEPSLRTPIESACLPMPGEAYDAITSAPPAATTPEPPFVPSPITTPPPTAPSALQPTPPTAPPPSSRPQAVPPQPSPQIPTKITPELIPAPEPLPGPGAAHHPTHTPPIHTPAAAATPPPPVVPTQAPLRPPAPIPAPVPVPAPVPTPAAAAPPASNIHHKDLNQAQKHAKWAISALNFDDVPTAVQELRNALAMLGAQ